MTDRLAETFGVAPFDVYATTEGLFGAECERHDGIHLFDDACVVENVDEDGRPVPPGTPGARVLVTNLHNLVQPIVRLAISDVMTMHPEPCPCGRSLARAAAIDGRRDDVLSLPARGGGTVSVLPAHFSVVTKDRAVREFQVRQEPGGVRVLVVPCDDATGASRRGSGRGRPCAGRRRCRGARGGRAPPRAGSKGREVADRARPAGISFRGERRRANGGGRARRRRAGRVVGPPAGPRRARQGARRRARGAPRPAADVLRGAAQPAQGPRRQAEDGRARRAARCSAGPA